MIADLLGVPDADRDDFVQNLHRHVGGGLGSTEGESLAHSPLEFIYGRFATYIEDRRREPRDDVLTGLATATFPDGSIPDVADVVRVATNVFSAGQETTVRLLGSALKIMAENPMSSSCSAKTAAGSRISSKRRYGSRARSRATSAYLAFPLRWAVSKCPPAQR
ncbi:putative cytochrome P450 [Mycobacterium xenopi 3993]|nr:putative cytochrome P450 [Mycobacterium xenopi 3993]